MLSVSVLGLNDLLNASLSQDIAQCGIDTKRASVLGEMSWTSVPLVSYALYRCAHECDSLDPQGDVKRFLSKLKPQTKEGAFSADKLFIDQLEIYSKKLGRLFSENVRWYYKLEKGDLENIMNCAREGIARIDCAILSDTECCTKILSSEKGWPLSEQKKLLSALDVLLVKKGTKGKKVNRAEKIEALNQILQIVFKGDNMPEIPRFETASFFRVYWGEFLGPICKQWDKFTAKNIAIRLTYVALFALVAYGLKRLSNAAKGGSFGTAAKMSDAAITEFVSNICAHEIVFGALMCNVIKDVCGFDLDLFSYKKSK